MSGPRARLAVVVAIASAILAVHVWRYWPFISDDAFISLRYAERWRDGLGLTWSDDQRGEGYSNLLWVMLTGILGFGMDLVSAARLLGVLGVWGAMVAVAWAFVDREPPGDWLGGLVAALGLALSSSAAVWAIGGLEQPLLIVQLIWAVVLLQRNINKPWMDFRPMVLPGVLLAGVCLTRPDGPLLVGLVGIGALVAQGWTRQTLVPLVALAAPSVIAVVLQTGLRLAYYGDWVPNTAHVKVAWSLARLSGGAVYLLGWALAHLPLFGLGALALLRARQERELRARLWVVGPATLAWMLYMMGVGGDIFPSWRQLLPALVGLALMAGEGAHALSRVSPSVAWKSCVALLGVMLALQLTRGENRRALAEDWEEGALGVGEVLRVAFEDERPLLAAQAAGALPYAARLPAHDMLGLNDRYLATHPPANLGEGFIGHELGDAKYTLGLKPDLMSFCNVVGSKDICLRVGQDIGKDRGFKKDYVKVYVRAAPPSKATGKIWFRRDSAKVGVRQEGDETIIPAWLFGSGDGAVAALNRTRTFGLSLSGDGAGALEGQRLDPGSYRAQIDGDGEVQLEVMDADGRVLGGERGAFEVKGGPGAARATFTLTLRAPDGAFVERVVLRKG